jgi:anti-sigma-K factor RskA
MSTHDELKALAAGYVLGSLDAEDRRAFEAHLAGCAECAAEIASLRPVMAALASTVPQVTPRSELRARVIGRVPGGAGRPRVPDEDASMFPGVVVLSWLGMAAALVLAVGAGVYAVALQRQVADLRARFDQAQSTTAVLAAPDLARIDLQGQPAAPDARARALWSRSRGLVFTAANLPPAPAGKNYQVWVVTAQAPVSAGLLMPDATGGGTQYYMTPPDIAPPLAVAVTLEPAGGVPAPTGDKYLVGMP